MFGNDIDSREDSLQMFRSYYIINAYVKLLDPKYKTESHEYQWIINAKTIIEEIPENEQQVEMPKYNLIPINELDAYKDSIAEIDLLAVALHIKPPKEITLTNGPATLQEIYVIDQSFNPISLTMWGRFVQDECKKISEIIETKPILLATKLKVRSYNGLSLSSRPASAFTINPVIPEAKLLQRWIAINDSRLEVIIAKSLKYPSTSLSSVGIRQITKNCDVAALLKSLQPMEAKINIINLDQIFFYMSCINCNKGTGHDHDESFLCYHCKHQSVAEPRCRAYVEVDDGTGKLAAVIFGELAEQALGHSAIDFMNHTGEKLMNPKNLNLLSMFVSFWRTSGFKGPSSSPAHQKRVPNP
ncbi:replication protein A 70 kDa DNA-binding subunit D-like [Carya illinoinensis]|uniref:replication protein A 70 kDa DNA-binding subunit D-like n=1 Tax=Carya illinoinensis TaxID=32201 RepID=UPI001C71AE01|nr:replication protein A 70 kDa DNA-binding subunit D-like [Carya illinoinensis]